MKQRYRKNKEELWIIKYAFWILLCFLLLVFAYILWNYAHSHREVQTVPQSTASLTSKRPSDPLKKIVSVTDDALMSDPIGDMIRFETPKIPMVSEDEAKKRGHPWSGYCHLSLSKDRPLFESNILSDDTYMLCYQGFATVYKGDFKVSLMSAERLTKSRVQNTSRYHRAKNFETDPILLSLFRHNQYAYITSRDYVPHKKPHKAPNGEPETCNPKETCDRGHLAPSYDMDSRLSRVQSNYLSNVVPQAEKNNKGVWNRIENVTRCNAMKDREIYVITLPIYRNGRANQRMYAGRHRVGPAVPDFMAKVIYSPRRQVASAYVTVNAPSQRSALISLKELNDGRFLGYDIGPLYVQPFPDALRQNLPIDDTLPAVDREAEISQYCQSW
ncbi:MAG: DNA/RNA non-specific endonuclease [Alcaligenaceae bacterium]|nr:DNA/RNA non-specific endonuclease [Alcaligenaceae bacterium]